MSCCATSADKSSHEPHFEGIRLVAIPTGIFMYFQCAAASERAPLLVPCLPDSLAAATQGACHRERQSTSRAEASGASACHWTHLSNTLTLSSRGEGQRLYLGPRLPKSLCVSSFLPVTPTRSTNRFSFIIRCCTQALFVHLQ